MAPEGDLYKGRVQCTHFLPPFIELRVVCYVALVVNLSSLHGGILGRPNSKANMKDMLEQHTSSLY